MAARTDRKIDTRTAGGKLRCVDLFAGAGGLSLAARNVGLDVVAAIEKDAHACVTYNANLVSGDGSTKLYENDILEILPHKVKSLHFRGNEGCDVVLGGPPCQGFSTHRINGAGINDPRNALVLRYFDFVAELRPKVFLMENVPGILWPRHRDFLDAFYSIGAKAGYDVALPVVLDARDFGVPQRRKRVFILGVRNDFAFRAAWPPSPTHGDAAAIQQDSKLRKWVAAGEVFSRPIPDSDPNANHMNHNAAMIEVFKSTPINGGSRHQSNRILDCHRDHSGHKDVYGRIDPRVPGPTMTTACINPSKGRFVHPTKHHGIAVRHAARFQTFPDDFIFHGGLIAAGQQIGNAVPVFLGEALLRVVAEGIYNGSAITASKRRKGSNNG